MMSFSQRLNHILARIMRGIQLPHWFNVWLPWLVFVATLLVTLTLWQNARQNAERELQAEFNYSFQEAVHDIEKRMNAYILLLQGMEGLFVSSDTVTRKEFRNYVAVLELKKRYPDVQAMGFIRIIGDDERNAHIATVRKEGFTEYDIHSKSKDGTVTSIVYIDPLDEQNRTMLGSDLRSDPTLRVAMERARNKKVTALSGKLMAQHADDVSMRPHFMLFSPVYVKQPENQEATHHPAKFVGWVYVLLHCDDILNVITAAHKEKIELAVYDGDQISDATLLAETKSGKAVKASSTKLKTLRVLPVAGHSWSIEARPLAGLEARFDRGKPRFILISGIGTSLLLALLMQMLTHGRAHAMRIAKEMNSALIQSEYRWKFALEGAGEGVWDWNLETGSVFLSARTKAMFGYEEDDPLGDINALRESFHPDDRQRMIDERDAHLEGKTPSYAVEIRLRCKDGSWRWVLIRGMIVSRDKNGKPLRMIGTLTDITEWHMKNESLRLAATVIDTMNEAVLISDKENRIVSVNPSFTKITGYTLEDVIGKNPSMLSDSVRRPETDKAIWNSLTNTGSWLGEIVNRRKTGELYIAWISISSVRNSNGEIINYVGVFSDISERKAAEQRTQYLAHYDPLTDLPNRALFNDRLRQALAICRRNQTQLALLFIDLNKFKPVNDTLGHAVGDMLLREVAYRLLDCIRESDTAARIGGDEFVVLLPGTLSVDDARTVADKILVAIEDPCELDGHSVRISASIGIAVYPQHGNTDQEILSNADNAMYYAKHTGFKPIVSFDEIPNRST